MQDPLLPPVLLVGVAVIGPVKLVPEAQVMPLSVPFKPPAEPGL